jgi:general secretion pathway protein L
MNAITGFFNRFVDGLALLAEPFEARRRAQRTAILVERGDGYEIHRPRKKTPETLAAADLPRLRNRAVELRLASERIVSRELTLPETSRDYLGSIIRNQLERLTPWAAERVVFDYAPVGRADARPGQIAVRVVATAREIVEASVARLAAAGVTAVAVGSADEPLDRPSRIDLAGGRNARVKASARRIRFALFAWASAVVVAGSFAVWRVADANNAAATIAAEIAQNRRVVDAAIARNVASGGAQPIIARRQAETPMVVLLDDLARLLPDGTYLTELGLDNGEVRLAGVSDQAPALIALLQDSPELTEVRFAAPTTRSPDGTTDSFQIVARLRPKEEPKT